MDQRVKVERQAGYSVGSSMLDREHRQLLRLCDRAMSCLNAGTDQATAEFHDILNDLSVYVNEHFRAEETLFRNSGFPLSEEHEAEHLDYQIKLTEFLLNAAAGHIERETITRYLTVWWEDHILRSDMRYAEFLKKAGGR